MFDFDVGKFLIVGIVALVVIPAKDLPRVLRQAGQMVGKMRRMASDFQSQFMEAMREADVADLKKDLEKATALDVSFDPLKDARDQIVKAIEIDPASAAALATTDSIPPEVAEVPAPAETMDIAEPAHSIEAAAPDDALEPPVPAAEKPARARKTRAKAAPADDAAEPEAPKKRARAKKAVADETQVDGEA